MAKDTQHFNVSEFTCKCVCGKNNIDQRVIDMAETIRLALGVPVHVNSGCRCDKHIGGVESSKLTANFLTSIAAFSANVAFTSAAEESAKICGRSAHDR